MRARRMRSNRARRSGGSGLMRSDAAGQAPCSAAALIAPLRRWPLAAAVRAPLHRKVARVRRAMPPNPVRFRGERERACLGSLRRAPLCWGLETGQAAADQWRTAIAGVRPPAKRAENGRLV